MSALYPRSLCSPGVTCAQNPRPFTRPAAVLVQKDVGLSHDPQILGTWLLGPTDVEQLTALIFVMDRAGDVLLHSKLEQGSYTVLEKKSSIRWSGPVI